MKYILTIAIASIISSCNTGKVSQQFSAEDETAIRNLHEQYRTAWLKNDSTAVADLFTSDGALIPPNNSGGPVTGKQAIINYWFPKADTVYVITEFDIDKVEVVGNGDLAFIQGTSRVKWDATTKGRVLSTASSTSDFLTLCRKVNNEWKIYRQMWNNKPSK
ncbi:MAG TPA: nuclear transport factor 2 family protein [Chitinophagaceae bacterium]|nr:nuclear transport factor 2 family protein [Chitinophagaceae bacterium]